MSLILQLEECDPWGMGAGGADRDIKGAAQVSGEGLSSLGFHDRHPGRAVFSRCWCPAAAFLHRIIRAVRSETL